MTSKRETSQGGHCARRSESDKGPDLEWETGLRHLYDSIVDEPLPDSFKGLLARLDEAEAAGEEDG